MEFFIRTTEKEWSQKKIEEAEKLNKIVVEGRKNPIWFGEQFLGIRLIDYQKWCFMNSWTRPYCAWLMCRGAGKTFEASDFLMSKMILIPNYKVYISTNSASQSIEVFKKIEDIAMQRIPSLKTVTDIFREEVVKSRTSETGFIHDPAGHHFELYNNSGIMTLSTNIEAIRGKRGSVFYDEVAWQTREQMAATEHFTDVDSSFGLGVGEAVLKDPEGFPLQLIYASSAGSVEYPFFDKYVLFAKKMIIGDPNYFVCDLNCDTIIDNSTVDGIPIKAHLTRESVQKALEEDEDAARRELYNKFQRDGGQNAVVKMETLIRNSTVRIPLLYNDTSRKKFIFCYDPARNYDNSILSIWQIIEDDKIGKYLQLERIVHMVDTETSKKTPLRMPEQVKIIKQMMILYNGENAPEWENIEIYIDSGAGGGGVSAVADSLLDEWYDDKGNKHRGVIDPVHKQYETARTTYPGAMPIVHLIDPQGYKNIMFSELEKLSKLDLIKFFDFGGKEYITLLKTTEKGNEFVDYSLSQEEYLILVENELLKKEVSYMTCSLSATGKPIYSLPTDKKNKMHDDRAYTTAMAAYALSLMRRNEIIEKPVEEDEEDVILMAAAPKIRRRW